MHWLDENDIRRARMGLPGIPLPDFGFTDYLATKLAPAIAKQAAPAPAKPLTIKKDPVYAKALQEAARVHNALIKAGLGEPAATFGMYQAYHETAAFNDPKYRTYNNASGIKYAGQKNATKGKNGYADFKSLPDWAVSEKFELTKKANPAGAKTLEDFATRLKKNGYYEDTYANYLHGLKAARLTLSAIPAADNADNTTDYNPNTGVSTPKKKSWFAQHPLAAGAVLTIGGIVIIKVFNNLVD